MSGINAINHPPIKSARTTASENQRKETQEKVAVGAGGAAGVTGTAAKAVSKRAATLEAKEKMLQEGMVNIKNTYRNFQTIQESKGFFPAFKNSVRKYADDIIMRLSKLKNAKIIGPIVKSPVTKAFANIGGGFLAFFVLVTGVSKAFRTGTEAIDKFKQFFNKGIIQ